jgi:1,4-dihydroxy-2-naphthoyl-CoA hydrolase
MYTLNYTVKMFDTDASGLLFLTSQIRMAHEAYEAFMIAEGLGIAHILKHSDFLLPIVHAETDYHAPSSVGDHVKIEMTAERINANSFVLQYRFLNSAGVEVGTAKTVHVAVDKVSRKKRTLPDSVRAALAKLSSS